MKYCSACGGSIKLTVPSGDNRERFVCSDCGLIHYQNPKIVTGAIITWQDKILLCKRAIEPRYGLWTVPAGYMENGETTYEGAKRETLEEARADIEIDELYATVNLPHISQVYLLFRAQLNNPEFAPGEESLEVDLFSEEKIPWDDLAFPMVRESLKLFFQDRREGTFPHRMIDIIRHEGPARRLEINIIR